MTPASGAAVGGVKNAIVLDVISADRWHANTVTPAGRHGIFPPADNGFRRRRGLQWRHRSERNTHARLPALFSGTTRVSRYQKGKTNLDFTGARDSEWQWHQPGRMQVCTLLRTDNHASTPPLQFFYRLDALPAAQPTASKHWRHRRERKCAENYNK